MAASSLLATLATAQTPRYTVTDLGTLGGTVGSANGINYEGRVAGAANLAQRELTRVPFGAWGNVRLRHARWTEQQ